LSANSGNSGDVDRIRTANSINVTGITKCCHPDNCRHATSFIFANYANIAVSYFLPVTAEPAVNIRFA